VPEPDNKEKNLAVQFLDFTLRGREFLKLDMAHIKDMKHIGAGAAAEVFKADYKHTDVAVKKLKIQTLIRNGELSLEYQREIEALTHFSHPNLLLFMGATAEKGQPIIVTEFCHGGTLFEVLHEKKKTIPNLTYKQRHKMALDIAKGMHFMHSLNPPLMHRDLKSLNLLCQ
jgi:serine/threonine protein kinase